MALPDQFWTPNEFGVRGGIENAFMSTTLVRDVAMGYAIGDSSKIGIVIEVQQGMVNRGADISFISQCTALHRVSCLKPFIEDHPLRCHHIVAMVNLEMFSYRCHGQS